MAATTSPTHVHPDMAWVLCLSCRSLIFRLTTRPGSHVCATCGWTQATAETDLPPDARTSHASG